jgi:hypothetical protein
LEDSDEGLGFYKKPKRRKKNAFGKNTRKEKKDLSKQEKRGTRATDGRK